MCHNSNEEAVSKSAILTRPLKIYLNQTQNTILRDTTFPDDVVARIM